MTEQESKASPYERLGGREAVEALAEAFYDAMERSEPALTAVHRLRDDDPSRVHPEARARFALFLVGWLGGPQEYIAQHGHPRLRQRHMHVPIDVALRDAWMRAMRTAMDERGVTGELRTFLETRLLELADFMRNREG